MENAHKYVDPIDDIADIMTIESFKGAHKATLLLPSDGIGEFVKDNKMTRGVNVFREKPLDATRVAWYNR